MGTATYDVALKIFSFCIANARLQNQNSVHGLLFNCVLTIPNKRICYVMLCPALLACAKVADMAGSLLGLGPGFRVKVSDHVHDL